MSTPLHAQVSGTFSTGATLVPVNVSLPSGYDYIEIFNLTDFASAAAATPTMRARGYSSLPSGSAYYTPKTNGAATLGTETMTATGGFTFVSDSPSVALGAAVVVTGISQASPAVLSTGTTTGILAGDVVRVYGTTAQFQTSGIDFTVGTVTPGVSFQLAYLDSSAYAAAATAGFYRKVSFDPRFYPRNRVITGITAANPAVVTLSVTHGFVAGEKVRLVVPSEFGMTQMNGLLATITAVSTANNTITLDIDSSAFTAFAYPTSAVAAAGVNLPQVIPVGEAASSAYANLLDDATKNEAFAGVQIGTTILDASKSYAYIARKGVAV